MMPVNRPAVSLRRWLVAALLCAATAAGSADPAAQTYAVYVNDDGAECSLMVDLRPWLEGAAEGVGHMQARRHLLAAITPEKLDLCEETSDVVAYGIAVFGVDAYGQPQWSRVQYLHEFGVERMAFRELGPGADGAELERALPVRP